MVDAAKRLFSREDSDSSALLADAESLARLINAAFRVGNPSSKGIAFDAEGVRSYMAKGNSLSPETPQASQPASMSNFRGDRGYLGLPWCGPSASGNPGSAAE